MPKYCLLINADLENINSLKCEDGAMRWIMKLKCGNCGEIAENIGLDEEEMVKIPGSRGKAHLVMKCGFCRRDFSVSDISGHHRVYTSTDSGKFCEVAIFECRGVSIEEVSPESMGFCAESDTTESHVDFVLDNGIYGWYGYDVDAEKSISVANVRYKLERK